MPQYTAEKIQGQDIHSRTRGLESFNRAILESALDCMIAIDSDDRVREFNPAAERTFGFRRDEVLGKELAELIIPRRLRERYRRSLADYLETGKGLLVGKWTEIKALRRDCSEVLVELAITPFEIDNEQFFTAHARDITERALQIDRFHVAAEAAPCGMIMTDEQGHIVLVNAQAEKLFGYARDELIGQLVHMLVPERFRGRHPTFRDAYMEQPSARPMGAGRDLFALRKDGSEVPVEIGLSPIKSAQGVAVLSTIVDISERLRVERRLAAQYAIASLLAGSHSLGEAGPEIIRIIAASGNWVFGSIWLWREEGEKLQCEACWHSAAPSLAEFEKVTYNTSLASTFGLPGRVFASRKPIWIEDVTRDPNFPRRKAAADAGICGGFGFPLFAEGEMEGVLELFSPSRVEPDADLLKLAEALGSQIGLFIQRRKVEMELQQQKEAAEAANAAKDRFLAMLSHELRTPLTPVLIWAGGMIDQPSLDPELQEGLKMICRNIELEAHLIDDLLDLTRLSRGKLQLQPRIVDLHEIVARAIEIVKDDLKAKSLNLTIALEATSHQMDADPSRLQQVFWNVLQNACKFAPEKGAVSVRSHNPLPNLVRIEVSDSGVGIAPENLLKIFNAFEQGDSRREGLGLGLAISKTIIEMHHGTMSAESGGLGKGSLFRIDLPINSATPTPPA